VSVPFLSLPDVSGDGRSAMVAREGVGMSGVELLAALVDVYVSRGARGRNMSASDLLMEAYMITHGVNDRDEATEAVGDMVTDAMCARS
jgi:hypothetical protein